jgi:PhzF family phenazine biosynthesis protein
MTRMNTSAPPSRHAFAVELVAAFTRDGAGGNLAGVVLDAHGIDAQTRQRAAAAVAVSETSFVRTADERTFEVEFFTPTRQVPDCGHATVATFARLAQRGLLQPGTTIKRTIAGDRDITVEGESVFMQQPRAALTPYGTTAEIAQALGVPAGAIVAEPVLADNGVPFVLVQTSRETLAAIRPDQRAIEALTERCDAIGCYVAAPGDAGYDVTTRMFAPRYGIPEESATGMAAGLLAGYLAGGAERAQYRIEQGAFMAQPSPSEIVARVERDRVLVGGTASLVRTLLLELEPAQA